MKMRPRIDYEFLSFSNECDSWNASLSIPESEDAFHELSTREIHSPSPISVWQT